MNPTSPDEWFKQAEYDLATADALINAGFAVPAAFRVHFALEKALKGLLHARLGIDPPRTHNLIRLLKESGCTPPEAIGMLIVRASQDSIDTRYFEDIEETIRHHPVEDVQRALEQAREAIEWIRTQL